MSQLFRVFGFCFAFIFSITVSFVNAEEKRYIVGIKHFQKFEEATQKRALHSPSLAKPYAKSQAETLNGAGW